MALIAFAVLPIVGALVLTSKMDGLVDDGAAPKRSHSEGIVLNEPSMLPSLGEQKAFWDAYLYQLVIHELMEGRYRVPEVNVRFLHLRAKVLEAFNRNIHLVLVNEYEPTSRAVRAAASSHDGIPTIGLIIPSIMSEFWETLGTGREDWIEVFRASVVVDIMHEMEHLADYHETTDFDLVIDGEVATWHKTCKYTIAPLVEQYGLYVGSSASAYYELWIDSNRGENAEWALAIREIYTRIDR